MEIENKYFTFFFGRDYDDLFKIAFGINFGTFLLGIMFCPSNWNKFYKSIEGKRFQNKEIRHIYNLSILQFHYFDYTGTDIIHMIIDEDQEYYPTDMNVYVNKLKSVFRYNIDKLNYSNINHKGTLFDLNYSKKPNGNYIYYLTVQNNIWWIENNLGCLLNQRYPDCYLSEQKIKYYFPKYHLDWIDRRYTEIPYIKIDLYEKEDN